MSYRLGIDIGTTFLTAARVRPGGTPTLVDLGGRKTRLSSRPFLTPDGNVIVGPEAAERGAVEPHRLLIGLHRSIGSGPLTIMGRTVDPVDVLAKQLRLVVDAAHHDQRSLPEQVVVAYPSSWEPDALPHLSRALQEAGLPGAEMCPASVAAAVQFLAVHQAGPDDKLIICDFGGGYLDTALVQGASGGVSLLAAATGVPPYGGDDIDQALLDHVHRVVQIAEPVSAPRTATLLRDCTEAKEALSSQSDVSIPPPEPGMFPAISVSRSQLEDLVRGPLIHALGATWDSLQSQGVDLAGLGHLVLVGQSSAIPLFRQEMARGFGLEPAADVRPKDDVALGAARYAAVLPSAAPGGILPGTGSAAGMPTTVLPTAAGGGAAGSAAASRRGLPIGVLIGAGALAVAVAAVLLWIFKPWEGDARPTPTPPTSSTTAGSPTPSVSPSPSPTPSPTPGFNLPTSDPLSEDEIVVPRGSRGDAIRFFVVDVVGGGRPVPLDAPAAGRYSGPTLSPDRRTLIYIDAAANALRTMAADGTDDQELIPAPAACGRIQHVSWDPTDTRRVVVECEPATGPDRLMVINLQSGGTRTLITATRIEDPTISPDGELVAYWARDVEGGPSGGSIYTIPINGKGEPDQLTDVAAGSDADPAWNADGSEIAFRRRFQSSTTDFDIFVMASDGADPRKLRTDSSRDEKPVYSPDGEQILFISNRTPDGEPGQTVDLWLMDAANGANIEPLRVSAPTILTPVWVHR